MENILTKTWSGGLKSLPPEMCLAEPIAENSGFLTNISEKTQKICAQDPIEVFNPNDPSWFDGSMDCEEDIRDIQNYFEYLRALDPLAGTGIPPYLSIRFIDDFVGYGVYAERDIEKGEFIGFYTGRWRLDEGSGSSYLFEALDDSGIFIDAKTCGNFTRYINHAYSKKCNLEAIIYLREEGAFQFPMVVYYTKKKIRHGQQLLINYGKQYWSQMGFKPA